MGEYANVKVKKIKNLLKWLEGKPGIIITQGGKHQMMVKHSYWKRPIPVPTKHGKINKHIVKDLMEKLKESEICTKEEFDEKIK